ncbi:NgoMIV family type II restriction endonuclease [Sphingopyxis sp.]|uniref:NgoMIV family type II restriction endonuclease n=1 Tax=Sphingopyxis sp. TaxID=1908224 RepID=UPI003D0C510C
MSEVQSGTAFITEARRSFHAALIANGALATSDTGVPSIADGSSASSVAFASGIMEQVAKEAVGARLAGQMAGNKFEIVVGEYLEETLPKLKHIRPGKFQVAKGGTRLAIAACEQYFHLSSLAEAVSTNADLAVAIGMDYLIKPDVMVLRHPEPDEIINSSELVVDDQHASLAGIRSVNSSLPLLHASVSCKWTMRSDRAQNARSEALNLVRNRKGRLPHIVVVTGEPTPGRLASLALGTGDIDCVYHIALNELREAVAATKYTDSAELLNMMIEGRRLRDIADLPLDLAT